jgi:hypothetical protein
MALDTEAACILTHRFDRLDQSGGYGKASRRLRCRRFVRVDQQPVAKSRSVVAKRADFGPLSADVLTRCLWRAGTLTAKINVLFPYRGHYLHPH